MSARVGLLPTLLHARAARSTQPSLFRSFHFLPSSPSSTSRSLPPFPRFNSLAITRAAPNPYYHSSSSSARSSSRTYLYALGLGLTALTLTPRRKVDCAATLPVNSPSAVNRAQQTSSNPPVGPPSESVLNLYSLGFGAVCGICAGVFVKKGLKAIAFVLGGAFVLLQYLSSKSYVTVDWKKLSSKYDTAFGTKTATGDIRYPTIGGFIRGIVDFLSANFQRLGNRPTQG